MTQSDLFFKKKARFMNCELVDVCSELYFFQAKYIKKLFELSHAPSMKRMSPIPDISLGCVTSVMPFMVSYSLQNGIILDLRHAWAAMSFSKFHLPLSFSTLGAKKLKSLQRIQL